MDGWQIWDRAYNIRGEDAVAGRDSKAQLGVVRKGTGRDEQAPVAVYVEGSAATAENYSWILGLHG